MLYFKSIMGDCVRVNWFRKRFVNNVINDKDYSLQLQEYMLENDSCAPNVSTARAYTFTNENMYQTCRHLNLLNKKVATVGSSGDQVFNAIFYGAREVTIIDANIYTEHIVNLKIAAMKNLDYNEFIEYWSENRIIDHKMYAKISHSLPKNSQIFWDSVYLDSGLRQDSEIYNSLFFQQKRDDFSLSEMFDTEENYKLLQEKLKTANIKFIVADFCEFPKKLKTKYDVIMLSNLLDYPERQGKTEEAVREIEREHRREFFETVNELINNNLRKNGKIQLYSSIRGMSKSECIDNFKKYIDMKYVHNYPIYRYRQPCEYSIKKGKFYKRPLFNDEYTLFVYEKDNPKENEMSL